ncbi:hypothetical protein ACQPXT_17290 [Streptomyces sp. CA-100214]
MAAQVVAEFVEFGADLVDAGGRGGACRGGGGVVCGGAVCGTVVAVNGEEGCCG